jgi:hypothetical protein
MRWKQVVVVLGCAGMFGCGSDAPNASVGSIVTHQEALSARADPIGLSLFFSNGQMAPVHLIGSAPRFLQEMDIVESVPSAMDSGIQPLIDGGTASSLNWHGVSQVEEIWVPGLDGTFTRERYYREAKWMEVPSTFTVVPVDAHGHAVGPQLIAHAGSDDERKRSDDDFVRRFVARQVAAGCPSVGDCTGATFRAEALIQLRDALDPEKDARTIPSAAAALQMSFSQLPGKVYSVDLVHQSAASESGYGFEVALEPSSAPANGSYYVPGEQVSFRITFRDGQGHRLFPPGQLPTYADFLAGQVESGLRYLDVSLATRLYYSLKHRESNLLAVLSGPVHELKTPQTVVDPNLLFLPQAPFATRAVDGYTAVAQTVPPAAIVFGGLSDPSLWSTPVSDVITFTVPADAEPGTYLAAIKARRDFGGEALNRGATVEIQVGQTNITTFTPTTRCSSCHQERTGFDTVLHGISDRRACFGCHSSLGIEFDNVLDIRVHTIHDRSERFDADVMRCANCHLSAPTGPARGLLP